jgi:HK97 family phage portal protein
MKFFGYEIRRHTREEKGAQFESVLMRLIAAREGSVGAVTPETCMQSPTVQALVKAIADRISVTPVHLYRKTTKGGREWKERMPDHPVAKLLQYPNEWQTRADFFGDATSCLIRYGNFYAYKARGLTGPIRSLSPIASNAVEVKQDATTGGALIYRVTEATGTVREYPLSKLVHVRGPARNFIEGDSPVRDVARSIALEIAAENFGWSFFVNGAVPLLIFRFLAGHKGFKTAEQEKQFVEDFQNALGGQKRHRAMLLPAGIETGDPVKIENDKAQFLETRKLQRTIIAGAFGVPPQYVGDLERGTWNNVEQQSLQFTQDVVYPVVQRFEAALERDLLTDEDWRSGVIIRFNLDSILRADFKSRQEGLQLQRVNGVLSPNEWREIEGRNPLPEDKGGEDYLRPSNMTVAGEEPDEPDEMDEPGADATIEDEEDEADTDSPA